jgi:predicted dehydrogenase
MDGRFDLQAGVFSRDIDVSLSSADLWGVDKSRAYSSITDMLHEEAARLDVVIVLSPTPTHFDHVSTVLTAGIDVICEKSLAMTSDEAQRLDELAKRLNRRLLVTYNYSGYPMIRELRELIRRGALGRIVACQIEMPQEGFLRRASDGRPLVPQEWRRVDGSIPTVCLDLGSHTHHLASFLLSKEPIELVASASHHGRIENVVDYVAALCRYPDDVDVSMTFGKSLIGYRNGLSVRIFGDEASAGWVQSNPEQLLLSRANGDRLLVDRASSSSIIANRSRYERFKAGHPAGFIEAFANLYWDFYDTLTSDGPGENAKDSDLYVFDASHAEAGLRMLEAMTESHRSREWITVETRAK